MDRDCLGLLPRVWDVLAEPGKALPDDTSLEKLLDWFTGLTNSGQGGSLLACPSLPQFLSAIINSTTPDPSVLSFVLKLTGLLSASDASFIQLQEYSILDAAYNSQHWKEMGLWEDPCVRIGWIQGLRSMLQHSLALRFFVQFELTKPLLQLQTDSSLFVASAANQLLAHILIFFQPIQSAALDCVGTRGWAQEESAEVSTQGCAPMGAHAESHAPTLGTNPEHAALTPDILEHIQTSLVLEEKMSLNSILQSLRLLAVLFSQARAPLLVTLIRTIPGCLEDLISSGHSQLTIPLMDVLLTAYKHPDLDTSAHSKTVSHLLSAMLETSNSLDLIHAATTVLRRSLNDPVHTTRAAIILLLPLDIITGLSLPIRHKAAVSEEQCSSLAELLSRKTPCTSTLCICLTYMPQITLMPSDLLPATPVSVVTLVLSLLRICGGGTPSFPSESSKAWRNVIGCSKIQRCGLEALTAISSCPGAEEKLSDVFTILVQYLNNPDSEPTVLQKCYQALIKWLNAFSNLSSLGDKLQQELLPVVSKRLCDVRWEVRDSTLEFLGQAPGMCIHPASPEDTPGPEAVRGCSTTLLLLEALQDTESYVRASAISALSHTLAHCWQQGAALSEEMANIVSRLLDILSQDTEGFPRRAVVRFFITWISMSSLHPSCPSSFQMTSVRSVLSQGCIDLDWEVKVHTLDLTELLLSEALLGHRGSNPGSYACITSPTSSLTHIAHPYAVDSHQSSLLHTHTVEWTHTEQSSREQCGHTERDLAHALSWLVEQGVVAVLLTGLFDCDRPVALKACHLLITLRDATCPPSTGPPDKTSGLTAVAKVSCELQGWSWHQEIRKCLRKSCDWRAGASYALSDRSNGTQIPHPTAELNSQECDGIEEGRVSVCEVLMSLGLEDRLKVLSQSSDHVHNSPLSLLQDILSATGTHMNAHTHPAQVVIVDCY